MQRFDLSTDFNGFVLFEPIRLADFMGTALCEGADLWRRFTTSEDGEEVVRQGIVTPILGIDDGGYSIVTRFADEASPIDDDHVIVENGVFPLRVDKRLVLADLAVLREWAFELGWRDVTIGRGTYGVTMRGFRRIAEGAVTDRGYEFVFTPESSLPPLGGSLERNMRVLTLAP